VPGQALPVSSSATQKTWIEGNLLHMGHTVLGSVAFDAADLIGALEHLESSLVVK